MFEAKCPFCGSYEFEVWDDDWGSDKVTSQCGCIHCRGSFNLVYTIKLEKVIPVERMED